MMLRGLHKRFSRKRGARGARDGMMLACTRARARVSVLPFWLIIRSLVCECGWFAGAVSLRVQTLVVHPIVWHMCTKCRERVQNTLSLCCCCACVFTPPAHRVFRAHVRSHVGPDKAEGGQTMTTYELQLYSSFTQLQE